ncbi:glucose 1-dehydrogenase [Pseudonocardia halophobica]|uniref:Dehydrogenase n=1 Tax=Pseudonocardia halophobica TaxID=29401 RepID=A0A9W6KZ46_9PSEU|nr:SDR family oxidoreductase [Pseudonocardia halophobica]GLL10636.1 dehydrogenase [Pseudonocardia halophobica]
MTPDDLGHRAPRQLEGRVALVVGAGNAGTGIGNGRATAIAFAREGAAVVVCADRDADAAAHTAAMIAGEGHTAEAVRLDVTAQPEVRALVERIVSHHGRLDVLHNNVGFAAPGGVVDVDLDRWDAVMDANLRGALLTMRHAIPVMVAGGGGSVVNISSTAGLRYTGVPYAAYYASKAALSHLTRTTAVEFAARGVRINSIAPGMMRTPMVERGTTVARYGGDTDAMWADRNRKVPMGRQGTPWDVADAAVFLAGDRSRYVTGIELVVDGGVTLGYGLRDHEART